MSRKKSKKGASEGKVFLFEEILHALQKKAPQSYNYKQLAGEMGIKDPSEKLLVNVILEQLKEKGLVEETDRGKFKAKNSGTFVTGKVDMTSTGAAYIVSEDFEQDIYISSGKLNTAVHGDTVKVKLYRSTGKRPEGEITEIIKRGKTEVVGTIQLSDKFAFLIPDNSRLGFDVYIPLENLNKAKNGQKVIAKIIQWPRTGGNPIGEVKDILGNAGENNTEMHAILAEFGLPYAFPEDVEKMTKHIPLEITAEEIKRRRDFRSITTFTIDPYDAKDFDDALSFRKLENGNYEIGVHIADVTHYVKEGSLIDTEAIARATSVYLVDRVVPMLPEVLSNNVCSLRPNEDKLCFSSVFEMNNDAEVLNEWFGRTIIHSIKRFSYEDAQQVIETGEGDLKEEILILDKLAKKLRANRMRQGSIAFDKLEVKFHLDESGNPTGVFFKQMKDSNQLIEDFMLLANRKVAEFVGQKSQEARHKTQDTRGKTQESAKAKPTPEKVHFPFVYRIHDKPDPDKLADFAQFAGKFGYKIDIKNDKKVADSMNQLMIDAKGKPEGNAIELLAIRTMSKAVYSTKNVGHYGLGFSHYTHFTSPIRRYPDVMVHRLLQRYLDHGKGVNAVELEEQCEHSSFREKLAADAERASIKYKQVQFLIDKIGQEFDGVVSGVTEWGIFVEIIENHCEGMIRLRDMRDDNYYFDEENYCIVGKRKGSRYTLGDKVRIEIKRADLVKKQIDFAFVEAIRKRDTDSPATAPKFEKRNNSISKAKEPETKKGKPNSFKDEWGFEI